MDIEIDAKAEALFNELKVLKAQEKMINQEISTKRDVIYSKLEGCRLSDNLTIYQSAIKASGKKYIKWNVRLINIPFDDKKEYKKVCYIGGDPSEVKAKLQTWLNLNPEEKNALEKAREIRKKSHVR